MTQIKLGSVTWDLEATPHLSLVGRDMSALDPMARHIRDRAKEVGVRAGSSATICPPGSAHHAAPAIALHRFVGAKDPFETASARRMMTAAALDPHLHLVFVHTVQTSRLPRGFAQMVLGSAHAHREWPQGLESIHLPDGFAALFVGSALHVRRVVPS